MYIQGCFIRESNVFNTNCLYSINNNRRGFPRYIGLRYSFCRTHCLGRNQKGRYTRYLQVQVTRWMAYLWRHRSHDWSEMTITDQWCISFPFKTVIYKPYILDFVSYLWQTIPCYNCTIKDKFWRLKQCLSSVMWN